MLVVGVLLNKVPEGGRRMAVIGLTLVALLTPSFATAIVPGISQPIQHPVPGGEWLAASAAPDGSFDLYLIQGSADNILALGETPWFEGTPDLSPDHRHIVFASDRDGSLDLFVMDLDPLGNPSGTRRLTHDPGAEIEPSWSPNGTKVLFSNLTRGRSTIAVVDAGDGSVVSLTSGGTEISPTWSPDGRSIAFAAPSTASPRNFDIWVMDADGAEQRAVIDATRADIGPRWSPDGRSIAFTGAGAHSWDVLVADIDGTGARNLTPATNTSDQAFGWSLNGSRLMFLSQRSHTGGNFLYDMDARDGSGVQLLIRL
jgi:TolB protein